MFRLWQDGFNTICFVSLAARVSSHRRLLARLRREGTYKAAATKWREQREQGKHRHLQVHVIHRNRGLTRFKLCCLDSLQVNRHDCRWGRNHQASDVIRFRSIHMTAGEGATTRPRMWFASGQYTWLQVVMPPPGLGCDSLQGQYTWLQVMMPPPRPRMWFASGQYTWLQVMMPPPRPRMWFASGQYTWLQVVMPPPGLGCDSLLVNTHDCRWWCHHPGLGCDSLLVNTHDCRWWCHHPGLGCDSLQVNTQDCGRGHNHQASDAINKYGGYLECGAAEVDLKWKWIHYSANDLVY